MELLSRSEGSSGPLPNPKPKLGSGREEAWVWVSKSRLEARHPAGVLQSKSMNWGGRKGTGGGGGDHSVE